MAESHATERPHNITIAAEYVSQKGQRSNLINNEEKDFKVKLEDDYLEFDISQNFFVSRIHFSVENVEPERLSLEIQDINSRNYQVIAGAESNPEEAKLTYEVGRILRSFRLNYTRKFVDWSKPFLYGIRVEGMPVSEIEPHFHHLIDLKKTESESMKVVADAREALERDRQALALHKTEFDSQIAGLTSRIAELQTNYDSIKMDIVNSEKARADAVSALESEKLKLDEATNKLSAAQTNFALIEAQAAQKQNEYFSLTQDVSALQTKLRNLKKTFATYSNEYASFNKQSNWYILFYSALLVAPIVVLGFVLFKLFDGAIDLTTMYTKKGNLDLLTIFVTRLPFVTIAGFLIYSSYAIFKLIAMKIIDTQSEKLSLAKLSIIAQDNVNLSSEGLKLTDDQIHDANIYLRMELVKAYMKNEIGSDFEYKARDSAIFDSIKGQIISRLIPKSWRAAIDGELKSHDKKREA